MALITCQVLPLPGRVTFRWSQGDQSFEPYYLEGESYSQFWQAVSESNERLRQLPAAEITGTHGFQLAQAGHKLWQAIFPEGGENQPLILEIRQWLLDQYQKGSLEGLDIAGDSTGQIPWTLVYETAPDENSFQNAGNIHEVWRNFWGIRYNLNSTFRVNPFRSLSLLDEPSLLLVLDPGVCEQLSQDQKDKLEHFLQSQPVTVARDAGEVKAHLQTKAPDLIYVFAPFRESGFGIGEATILLQELRGLLESSKLPQEPWNNLLLFVNPARQDHNEDWQESKQQLLTWRMAGLIYPEYELPLGPANQFGLEVLDKFLFRGDFLGEAVQDQRSALGPAGLLYQLTCPSRIQVRWPQEGTEDSASEGYSDEPVPNLLPLPEKPYRPFVACDRQDRPLFVGRERDIISFAEVIETSQVAVLHGRSGVGKTSLLQAGVIPFLLEESLGFDLLRDRFATEEESAEKDYPLVVLRTTRDLVGQLVLGLGVFAGKPYSFTTPTGREVNVNLPEILSSALLGTPNENFQNEELYGAIQQNPALAAKALQDLSSYLPHDLVIAVEQGEELFSLTRTKEDVEKRKVALEILQSLIQTPGHCKFIWTLRTEYFGRIIPRISLQEPIPALATYFLPALSFNALLQAALQPTLDEPIPYSSEIPLEKYDFEFEENLCRSLVSRLVQEGNQGGPEPIISLHLICSMLYDGLKTRPDRTIRKEELDRLGLLQKEGTSSGPLIDFQRLLGFQSTEKRPVRRAVSNRTKKILADAVTNVDQASFTELLQTLASPMSGGNPENNLLPLSDLEEEWKGKTPLPEVVEKTSSRNVGLLAEVPVFDGETEEVAVSLGSDSLAPIVTEISIEEDKRKYGNSKMVDTLFICIPLLVLLAAWAWSYWIVPYGDLKEKRDNEMEQLGVLYKAFKTQKQSTLAQAWPLYVGNMHQARRAWEIGDLLHMQELLIAYKRDPENDLRGFEWYHLWHLANQHKFAFLSHMGEVLCLEISPDGKILISGGADGAVKLWDLEAGVEIHSYHRPEGAKRKAVHCLAVSPDGKRLAVGGQDKEITLVTASLDNFDQPQEILGQAKETMLQGHEGPVTAVVFSADGKNLISASNDNTIRIWDVQAGTVNKVLEKEPTRILERSPDGETFVTGAETGKVIFRNFSDGKEKRTMNCPGPVEALCFSPDGKKLACGGSTRDHLNRSGFIQVFDVESGKVQGTTLQTSSEVLSLVFSPSGEKLFSGGNDRKILEWDVAGGKVTREVQGHVGWISTLAASPKFNLIISGSYDTTIKAWPTQTSPNQFQGSSRGNLDVALSPLGKEVAAAGSDGSVWVWDTKTGKERFHDKLENDNVTQLALANDLEDKVFLGYGTSNGKLVVHNLTDGKISHQFEAFMKPITDISFSNLGKRIAAADTEGNIRVWDLQEGEIDSVKDIRGTRISFSLNGNQLAVAEGVNPFLFDLSTGEKIEIRDKNQKGHPLESAIGHAGPILSISFLGILPHVVTTSRDGTLKHWDFVEKTERDSLRGHIGAVNSVATSENYVFTGGTDGTVRVWDLVQGERFTFNDHKGPVNAVAASGRFLASTGRDGVVRLYRAAPTE